jgi:hypothetical protein
MVAWKRDGRMAIARRTVELEGMAALLARSWATDSASRRAGQLQAGWTRRCVSQPIRRTICKSGWTKTIRPPVSYTNALKIQQMVLHEETGSPFDYEEDHFIPLELGGSPAIATSDPAETLEPAARRVRRPAGLRQSRESWDASPGIFTWRFAS